MLRRIPPVILVIVILAVYGFLLTFMSDPINTLIVLGLSVLLFLIVRNFLQTGRFFSGKFSSRPTPSKKQPPHKPKISTMRPSGKKPAPPQRKNHPFRVIDGKKGKSSEKQSEQDSKDNFFQ